MKHAIKSIVLIMLSALVVSLNAQTVSAGPTVVPKQSSTDVVVIKVLQGIHNKLNIRPEQEKAWSTFTNTLQHPLPRMDMVPEPDVLKLPTPQRIDALKTFRQARWAEFSAMLDRTDEATKAMYSILDPTQQSQLDAFQFGLR